MIIESLQTNTGSIREQKEKHVSTLKEFLDLVDSKIVEIVNEKGVVEKRIVEPFEARIDKKSIAVDDLKRIGRLPIEVGLFHDENGDLILNTGSVYTTEHDYGDEHRKRMNAAKDKELDRIIENAKSGSDDLGFIAAIVERDEDLLYLRRQEVIENAYVKLKLNSQPFTGHNHPSGSNKMSLPDSIFFSYTGAKQNFIITNEGTTVIIKPTEDVSDRIVKFFLSKDENGNFKDHSNEEIEKFLFNLNFKVRFIKFTDPEIGDILKIIRGEN